MVKFSGSLGKAFICSRVLMHQDSIWLVVGRYINVFYRKHCGELTKYLRFSFIAGRLTYLPIYNEYLLPL